jgi:YHS domain-containing protein
MKILPFVALSAVALLNSSLSSTIQTVVAAPAKTQTTSARPRCPKCMMKLSPVKTASMVAPIKVGGKTYYCCAACAEDTAAKQKAKPKGKPKKAASIPQCPKCKMQMVAAPSLLKKTAMRVNGKTYYCCTICPKH